MLRRWFIFTLLLVGLLPALPLHAQDPNPKRPPAILSFTLVDPITPTIIQVEAGEVMVHLAWETINLPSTYCCVAVERLELGDWVYQDMPNYAAPPISGDVTFPMSLPYNFGPVTYRLVLRSMFVQNIIYDQQVLEIPIVAEEGVTPSVLDFGVTNIKTIASTSQFDVEIEWAVKDRQPFTNIEFVQVMQDGSTQYIELDREHLWVASAGKGVVRPSYPQSGTEVIIRVQVVDVRTGDVLDDFDVSLNAPTHPTS